MIPQAFVISGQPDSGRAYGKLFYISKIHYLYVPIYAIKTRTCQTTNVIWPYGCNSDGGGGEIAAFRELFDRHYAPLCRFAEFWIRDRTSAEEVVLDVYTYLWQHAAELQITVSVRAYLFRAVRNRALNRLRDDRFSYIPFDELGEIFAGPDELRIETDEIMELVAEAVSQLPDRCRDIFLKSRREQLSNAEIAAEMQISVKTVEAQMSKALRRLRRLLHKE